ncbi:tyrosine-type recombinase/integrase [Desulfovibrio gilichinskyi]|nr:site-specific integrase [Desulfovibrio gilichinskyi]
MKNTKTGLTPVTDITYDLVERALNHIAKTVSPHRANVHRKLLVAAWNWGIKAHDLPPKNPFSVDSYKVDKTEKYIPPIDDFWTLVDSVKPHEQRLLLTFLYTGSRRNEILSLKWKDVDFNKNIVWLETRKRRGGGVHRDAVPMVDALKEALQEQRLETGLQGFVFINPSTSQPYSPFTKLMNGWCSEAQIKPFNFHAIRHLSASILADKGYSLPDIQKLLRHKAVTTTAHYLHSLGMTSLDLEGAFDRPVKKQKVSEMVNRTEKRVNEIACD